MLMSAYYKGCTRKTLSIFSALFSVAGLKKPAGLVSGLFCCCCCCCLRLGGHKRRIRKVEKYNKRRDAY